MGRRKLIAHRAYRLRSKGSSLSLTVPRAVLLFTKLRPDEDVWMYGNSRGDLILSVQKDVAEEQ